MNHNIFSPVLVDVIEEKLNGITVYFLVFLF